MTTERSDFRLERRATLPSRGGYKTGPDSCARHPHRMTQDTYVGLIARFIDTGAAVCEVIYDRDTVSAWTLYNGLLRHKGGAALVAKRDDRMYLARPDWQRMVITPPAPQTREARREERQTVVDILATFAASESHTSTLTLSQDVDSRRVYRALQYQRTQRGYGYVRIAWSDAGIVLTKDL